MILIGRNSYGLGGLTIHRRSWVIGVVVLGRNRFGIGRRWFGRVDGLCFFAFRARLWLFSWNRGIGILFRGCWCKGLTRGIRIYRWGSRRRGPF